MRFGNKTIVFVLAGFAIISSCAPAPKVTKQPAQLTVDTSAVAIDHIRAWVDRYSRNARSLNATGDITVDEGDESNSASFRIKSKRIGATGNRIDSLSIEVSGPFGITVARLLASPERYQFHDVLHGQTLAGPTTSESLEALTHLHGVTLGTMSDVLYGLPPSIPPSAAVLLYSGSENDHMLIIRDFTSYTTTYWKFEGTIPSDSTAGSFFLRSVERWNGIADHVDHSVPPDIAIRFSDPVNIETIRVPKRIEVNAGENKLELEYDRIELNSPALVVRIKMPE